MQQRDEEVNVLVAMLRERAASANGHPPALPDRVTEAPTAGMCFRSHVSALPSCPGLTDAVLGKTLPRSSAHMHALRQSRRTRPCYAPSTATPRRSARRSACLRVHACHQHTPRRERGCCWGRSAHASNASQSSGRASSRCACNRRWQAWPAADLGRTGRHAAQPRMLPRRRLSRRVLAPCVCALPCGGISAGC